MDVAAEITRLRFTPFEIGALVICLTCFLYTVIRQRTDRRQNKLYLIIVINLFITSASDVAAELIRTFGTGPGALMGVQVAAYIYFVTHTALAPLLLVYVFAVCRESKYLNRNRMILAGIPFFVMELIALTNPLTHWMYSYDANMNLTRNWAMYAAYVTGLAYQTAGFAELLYRWRALTAGKHRAFIYFYLVAVVGVVVQFLAPFMCTELFAESIAILGIMLFVENEDGLIDFEAGVYNRHALQRNLDMYAEVNESYNVVMVDLANIESYLHIGGSAVNGRSITETLAGYLKTLVPWHHIYRATPIRYVLLDPKLSYDEAQAMGQQIADRFAQSWEISDASLDIRATVAVARAPQDLPTPEDVFYLIDTPVPPATDGKVLLPDDLDYLVRRGEVERAVMRGFDENSYEVYYQPIFNKYGKPCSTEALMRLHDSELGFVPPPEFIEVAERMGQIDEIGDFALNEVCDLLASGAPQKYGVERIGVNLSVVQCMQTGFAKKAYKIVCDHGIDPSSINFEITESIAAGDYGFLGKVIMQLKEEGHSLSMDDYGTGYSNMHSLVTLKFDVVKIDKSVLWDSQKNQMGLVILQNSVKLLHDIGCRVLVEGVETEQQVNLLRELDVDLYQGFYYAKPMPKDEYLAFLASV